MNLILSIKTIIPVRKKIKNTRTNPQQGTHGTATLSAACGFKEGKLIGPAFGAEIILGKTEYTPTETPMEEDYWIEAAEWAEAKGADVITSSLGYKDWDDPFTRIHMNMKIIMEGQQSSQLQQADWLFRSNSL